LILALSFASCSFAQEERPSYGLEPGSVGVFAGAGTTLNNGTHTALDGGVDVGLFKRFGLYAEASDAFAHYAHANAFYGGGGIMVTANNHSRIVPYGRVGMDYGKVSQSVTVGRVTVSSHLHASAVRYGGGIDAYATRNFGVEVQVADLYTVGRYGGTNATGIIFGVFYRTR
jgi:hypothetical protein